MTLKAFIHMHFKRLSQLQRYIVLIILACLGLYLFILFIKTTHHLIFNPKLPTPVLIREGETIHVPKNSALRQQLVLQTIQPTEEPHTLIFPGIVEAKPKQVVNIYSIIPGKIEHIAVNLGSLVEKNTILATIASPDYTDAQNNVKKAQASLQLASETFKRVKAVYQAGGNTRKELEIAERDFIQAQANMNQAYEQLHSLSQTNNPSYELIAPIAGQVTAIHAGIGTNITDTTSPILTIANIDKVWITANIPEHLARFIELSQEAKITFPAFPGKIEEAHVTFVSPFLDPETRRNKTRLAIDNPQHMLQPNMFANVAIKVKQPALITIPISSIVMNNDIISVYVETSPWTFTRREVQLGFEDHGYVRVISGLRQNERIVVSGGVLIND